MIGGGRLVALEDLQPRLIAVDERTSSISSFSRLMIGTTCVPPSWIIQPAIVARPSGIPSRSNCGSWRYSGMPSTNFAVVMCARSDGVAMLFGKSCSGHRRDLHALVGSTGRRTSAGCAGSPGLGRAEIQLLGDLLADALERRAVARADLLSLGQIVNDLDPGQIGSELLAAALRPLMGRDRDRLPAPSRQRARAPRLR